MAEALEVDAGSIRRESLLVADLGATLINLLDLHYRIEKKFDVYLSKVASFWEPTNAPGRITAGMVVDCVVDTIRSRFKGPT